jgi:hypothetical protein
MTNQTCAFREGRRGGSPPRPPLRIHVAIKISMATCSARADRVVPGARGQALATRFAGAEPRFVTEQVPEKTPGTCSLPRGRLSARGQGAECLRWRVLYTEPI